MSSEMNGRLRHEERYASARNLELDCGLCYLNKTKEERAEFLYLNCPLCLNCWVTQMKAGDWTPDTRPMSVCELLDAFGKEFRIVEMEDPQVDNKYLY